MYIVSLYNKNHPLQILVIIAGNVSIILLECTQFKMVELHSNYLFACRRFPRRRDSLGTSLFLRIYILGQFWGCRTIRSSGGWEGGAKADLHCLLQDLREPLLTIWCKIRKTFLDKVIISIGCLHSFQGLFYIRRCYFEGIFCCHRSAVGRTTRDPFVHSRAFD